MTRIRSEIGADVARLTLDDAEQRNILDEQWWSELATALDRLETATSRAIVVTGEGDAFSAGGDIVRMREALAAIGEGTFAASERARMDRNATLMLRWSALSAIRIAVVNGPAVGAGLALALSCDHRIMADTAFLDTGFSRLGLPGDLGATHYLRSLLGPHRANAWLLRARRMGAADALALGLTDEVCAPTELRSVTDAAVRDFLALSPEAVTQVLHRDGELSALAAALESEREATVAAKQSEFHRDAVERFVARLHKSDQEEVRG